MTFDEYQQKARTTLLPAATNVPYVALGLVNEAGEVAGKIKKWIRDADGDKTKLDKSLIGAELGDTLWYAAMLAEMLDLKLSDVAQANLDKLSSRAARGKIQGSGDER